MTLSKAFPNLDEEYRSSLNYQLPVRVSPTHFECFASHESVNIRIFNQLTRVLVPIEPQYDKRSRSVEDTDGIVGLNALWFDASPSISGSEKRDSLFANVRACKYFTPPSINDSCEALLHIFPA